MLFPNDAQRWVGKIIVLEWQQRMTGLSRTIPMSSGGRALRVDDTYLYLQPFALDPSKASDAPVTTLTLKVEEEPIPLVDITSVFAAPLDGIQIIE
jgi:hypothetical protein